MMLSLQGFGKTGDGMLRVIGVAVGTALPAGTMVFNGLAQGPNGALYVVFA